MLMVAIQGLFYYRRDCQTLQYIPSTVTGVQNSPAFFDIRWDTKTLLTELRDWRVSQMSDLQTINMAEASDTSVVDELGRELHQRVGDLIKAELESIASEYESERDRIRKDTADLDDHINVVEARHKKMSELQDDNESELFVIMKQAKKQDKYGKQMLREISLNHVTLLKYRTNVTVEDALGGLETVGHFGQTVKVLQEIEYSVKTAKDTDDCYIADACLLVDGSVIAADWKNKSIKHLNDKRVHRLELGSEPSCVCRTSCQTEVAVTLPNTGKVQFVSLGTCMEATRSFKVGDACRGIYFINGQFFICCGSVHDPTSGSVRVFDQWGSSLYTIQSDHMGQQLFGIPRRITVSSDGTQLHVTDKEKGVVTVDRAGSLLARYTDIDDACGVCAITGGELLVSGLSSGNILHLSCSGRKLADVLSIAGPASLCYDEIFSRLVVCTLDSDTITMVDLLVE